MSSWPLALAVWIGAAGACLAAEPHPTDGRAVFPAVASRHSLSLDLALRRTGLDGAAAMLAARRVEAPPVGIAGYERPARRFDLHLGRTARAGRSPGEAPPLYGEVGIDLDPEAGLSLVPSYRVVLDDGEGEDSHAIAAQVLKLGARIRF